MIQNYVRGNRKRDIAKDAVAATVKGSIAIAKELTTKRESGVLPKAVSDSIQQLELDGAETIERMVVVRTPVQAYVGELMQIVSFGKYSDVISESDYDRMFHLSLLINGRYVLQKNEVISLTDSGESSKGKVKGSEVMAVKMPPREAEDSTPLTFSLLLDRTKQHMGPHSFSNYCAKTNNCQDFILAVLESNKMAYPHLVSFLKQDSEIIFNKLPIHTTQVARALTNIAAVGDKVVEDVKVKHQRTDYEGLARNVGKGGMAVMGQAGSFVMAKHQQTDYDELAKSAGKGGKMVMGLAGTLTRGASVKTTKP
mmetsp:Transcript_11786/g.25447  ORF Transcript_11786/g.25447 Transcript_11786/m.25447 type:complete len:311 (+) Transcript_11786:188-1120(+)